MYSINRLNTECTFALMSAKAIPVKVVINARLTRTLGQAVTTRRGGVIINQRIEFSKAMLEDATDEQVKDVLLHECAHIVAMQRDPKVSHGHDEYFKAICHELGTDNDGYATKSIRLSEKHFRYLVTCAKCEKTVARYHRTSKVVEHPEKYRCGLCQVPGTLTVKKQW